MAMTPEQQRKKADAMEESLRHARYGMQASDRKGYNESPATSSAIKAAGRRVDAATAKEKADIGGENASINDNRY